MIPPFQYKIPKNLREACNLLWDYREKAKVIAGGTDLIIALRNGLLRPEVLIDITHLSELRKIEERNGIISIGGAVTHSEISDSPIIRTYGRILSEAASQIGSPQIRNTGTIGGNVINASPAADTLPPLMVLEAMGKVVSKEGEKEVPIDSLIQGPYRSTLLPHEILVSISFKKLPPHMKDSFIRLARRDGMAIARMSIAVLLQREGNRMKEVRISVGAITPTPQRMKEAESLLEDQPFDLERLRVASEKVSSEMVLRSGVRPSTSYKSPVVKALMMRAIQQAFENRP